MEVSLLKVSSNLIEKPVLSNSNHSPITRPGELVLAAQESDKCKHFTIRGFVSKARKRNAKNCWPFPVLNDPLDKHVDVLPPLPVKKFRRWGCQSCLNESIAPETFTANGANMTDQNDGVKNKHTLRFGDATEASDRETKKLLVRFQKQSKENSRKGITVQEDNSPRISSDGQCSLLYRGKKHDASPTSDLIKGGTRVAKGGYNQSQENQSLRTKTNAVTAEEEYQTGEKGEGNIVVRANVSEISLLSEDSPKSLSSKWDRTALVHLTGRSGNSSQILRSLSFTLAASDKEQDQRLSKIGKRKELNSHVPEHSMPLGVDAAIPKDDAVPAPLARIYRHDSKDLDECGDEASDASIPLIRNLLPYQGDVRKPGITTVEKSRPKKSCKMRTLDDIMKSEEIQNDEKNCSSGENAVVSGSGSIETPDVSKQKEEQPNHKCHLIINTEPSVIKRKSRKEALTNEGEANCLIHLLKKVPRKTGLHKGEGEGRHINTAECAPKFTTAKGLDSNLEDSGCGENKQEMIGEKTRNMMPEVEVVKSSFMPQEDRRAQKGHIITKDRQTANLHPKSSGIIISENELHHKIEIHGNIRKEAPLSNKKNKRPLVEDGTSAQQSSKKEAAFKVHREVKKKQKAMQMSEQEAGDDIPMDIVELLAKKQQERYLTNTKHDSANMSKLAESTGNMDNGNGRDNTAGGHGSRVADAVNGCLYQQEPQCNLTGYDTGTSTRINGDAECRSKSYHSCSRDEQYNHFDLNKEAPVCSSAELQTASPYIGLSVSGAELSIVDSNRHYSAPILSTNGMKMLDFCSNQIGQTVPPQNMFSNAHDGSCRLLNGYPPQINAHKVCSDFSSHAFCLGVNLKTVAHNTAYRMTVNPDKDKSESSPTGGILAAKSFAESRNGYYSNMMWPVDLHDNESISALNLLELMHHSACSSEPFHSSGHNDKMGYIQASNGHGSELLGSEVDGKDPRRLSGASGNWELDKREENLCKPLRPLPRFGILGPLLLKEITNTSSNSISTNTSSNSISTLGFGARNHGELTFHRSSFIARQSNELTFHKTTEKGKAENSPLAPVTKAINVKTSMSRYGVSARIDSSVSSLANPGCTLSNDNMAQVVPGSRDGAFQPIRSSCKMEECVVNRNPADFAMPDDDSEYMIGYQETKTKDMPRAGSLLSRTHRHNQKRQKMRKLDDLNHYRTSKKSSLSRFSCPQKAMQVLLGYETMARENLLV